jgi:hypothetical protein
MNVWKLLSALAVGISTSTFAHAQNLDDLDLTKGILALQCSDKDGDVVPPMVFVQGDNGWVLNGSEDVVVTEIDDGFRITRTNDLNWMAFVTEEKSADWTLRVISERFVNEVTCTNIQDLVEILIATIAPRIADNFSDIAKEVSDTIPALRAEIADLIQLKGNLPSLTAKLERLEASLDVLLENPIQRMAFEIGAFTEKYGYDMSDQDAFDFKFDSSKGYFSLCSAGFEREYNISEYCLDVLREALLPNPD